MRRLAIPFLIGCAAIAALTVPQACGQDKNQEKIEKALPSKATAKPKQPRNILIYSKTAGFRHSSIPTGVRAITLLGDKTGAFTATASEDESMFEPEKLKKFDAVLMLNTTGHALRTKDNNKEREEMLKKSLQDFVAGGKGLIGIHSATDTYQDWKEYNKMMGGAFVSHPWHQLVPVKNLAPDNPVNAAFGGKDFQVADEIYMFRNDTALPSERKILLALDTKAMKPEDLAKDKTKEGTPYRKDGVYAVSWIATYGKGRTFYCSLGHRDEIFWNPVVMQHYLAGIQYALGDLDADATPGMPGK
jgi:type 1 glutamine amidotransferase